MGIVKWEGSIYQFSVKSLLDFGERLEQFMVFININVVEGRRGPFIFLDEIFFDALVVILTADLRSDVMCYSCSIISFLFFQLLLKNLALL